MRIIFPVIGGDRKSNGHEAPYHPITVNLSFNVSATHEDCRYQSLILKYQDGTEQISKHGKLELPQYENEDVAVFTPSAHALSTKIEPL